MKSTNHSSTGNLAYRAPGPRPAQVHREVYNSALSVVLYNGDGVLQTRPLRAPANRCSFRRRLQPGNRSRWPTAAASPMGHKL